MLEDYSGDWQNLSIGDLPGPQVEWLPCHVRRTYPDLFDEQGELLPGIRERLLMEVRDAMAAVPATLTAEQIKKARDIVACMPSVEGMVIDPFVDPLTKEETNEPAGAWSNDSDAKR